VLVRLQPVTPEHQIGAKLLSDKSRDAKSPKRRAVDAPTNVRWSDTQKIEALQTFLLLGGVRAAANALKIPEVTIRSWQRQEWWQEMVKDISAQENIAVSNKLKKIIDKSLDLTLDRLEKGDFIYDQKTGQMKRKPVALRDIHRVAMDSTDRRLKLQTNEQTVVHEENVMSKLEKLASSFAQFANQQDTKAPVQVTDVIFVSDASQGENHSVHEEGPQDGEVGT
jgi:hypothetical protein